MSAMYIKNSISSAAVFIVIAAFMTSCDTTNTNMEPGKGNVEVQLKTSLSDGAAQKNTSANTIFANDSLIIEGINGSLEIDDIRFIVDKFKLEPEDIDAEDDSTDSEIEEFEAEPFFVDLPLHEDTLSLANGAIAAGLYEEFEFEIGDLDFEEDEDEEAEENPAVTDSILSNFPNWPEDASLVVTGTFTPTGGASQPFTVFAEAEVEIEREFEPSLEVTESNMAQVVSVNINPVRWLTQSDGTVVDLSAYDWEEHQELLEFSAKFKDGVEDIEVDDDDFDDDDD